MARPEEAVAIARTENNEPAMTTRLSCCVPFCRRTRHNHEGFSEWICGDHWRLVPPLLRKRKAKMFRLYRRRYGNNSFWAYPGGSPNRLGAVKLDRLCDKVWKACKKAAIERAAGI